MRNHTGATAETIIDCVIRRVGQERCLRLAMIHGIDRVNDELDSVGSFFSGCEEIGSSDTYYFAESFLNRFKPSQREKDVALAIANMC